MVQHVSVQEWLCNPERQEELCRRLGKLGGCEWLGESPADSEARFQFLDSVAFYHALQQLYENHQRRQAIQQALLRRKAQEEA